MRVVNWNLEWAPRSRRERIAAECQDTEADVYLQKTATTFDVVDTDGAYIGGAIAPGVSSIASTRNWSNADLPRSMTPVVVSASALPWSLSFMTTRFAI